MVVNPDPRPGRWLLPLVVLGMVVFAYVFVNALPNATAERESVAGESATTTTTTVAESETTTTTVVLDLPPEYVAYLETVNGVRDELTGYQTEMATINGQWDADPREIDYATAESGLEDLAGRVATWSDAVAGITPPTELTSAHELLTQFATAAADSAAEVLTGLQSSDTGEARRTAAERFDQAVRGFTAAAADLQQQAGSGTSS